MRPKKVGKESGSLKQEVLATELGYLWVGLRHRGVLDPYRRIGFCSIGDDEGSSTLTANLALFVGARGVKVAIVEATLRVPAMTRMFDVSPDPGLAALLAGGAGLRDVLRMAVAPGVDLVPAGTGTDPFWAFATDRFGQILQDLLADHELCLVGVPGLEKVPEARLVLDALDAVVLVVEASRHRADTVRRAISHLRSIGVPFLGAVLSDLVHDVPASLAFL